ncbi:MAG: helix-turn-helix transcriptional regulator [Candidatus Aminicenantes bacterium]|nr:helix-turn-helix transcriptional regulator [Candidatus Aminicenantes bacterium]
MKHQNLHEKAVEYIYTRNLQELSQLTRYMIADFFNVNQNYLSKKFKKETGMTISKFLAFEKMRRAEQLLKTRFDLPVIKISEMVGIVKPTQFRKKFQKIFFLKPGKYRRLFQGRR